MAPTNERERKKAKFTIGALTRRSITTKAERLTTETASRAMIRPEPQCQGLPSTSASTSVARPTVSAAIPG